MCINKQANDSLISISSALVINSARRKNSAFTLIEMLVVIAIISILASMMSPLLRQAYKESVTIACINNLKNLSMVMTEFDHEYRELPPTFGTSDKKDATYLRWKEKFGTWFDTYTPWQSFLAVYMYPEIIDTDGSKQKVYRDAGVCRVFTCPALGGEWSLTTGGNNHEQHYAFNTYLRGKTLRKVRNPSRRLLLGEPEFDPQLASGTRHALLGGGSGSTQYYLETEHPGDYPGRHNPDTTPISYADGHVRKILGIEVHSFNKEYSKIKNSADLEKCYFWGKGYQY